MSSKNDYEDNEEHTPVPIFLLASAAYLGLMVSAVGIGFDVAKHTTPAIGFASSCVLVFILCSFIKENKRK